MRKVTGYTDAGAYSRHSPYGAQKGAAHYPGPYTVPNVWIDTYCVYTNRTPSSAMRGFGVTIADFALEVSGSGCVGGGVPGEGRFSTRCGHCKK